MHSTGKRAIVAAMMLTAFPLHAAEPPLARVFLKDGLPGEVGGSASIFGTNGAEDITLRDEPGRIEFDGSFNRGNDTIRLPGAAAAYTVQRQGSRALLTDGGRSYSIPVGAVGIPIVFSDGARRLAFRAAGDAMFLGGQQITVTAARVDAPAG